MKIAAHGHRKATREEVWGAMVSADGDRVKAANKLGIGLRSLARHFSEYDMHADIERMGWKGNPGPPVGVSKGSNIIQMMILSHIRKYSDVKIELLVDKVFGQDTPSLRGKLYAMLSDIRKKGLVDFDGDRWTTTTTSTPPRGGDGL